MDKYNFDKEFDRRYTNAEKWKNIPEDCISMTVADMDFPLAPEIVQGVKDSLDMGDFGYVSMTDRDYNAVIDWCKKIHGYTIDREALISTPGVLYAMRSIMYTLTKPGDKVIVQTPLHTPSIASAAMQGRIPVHNNLIYGADGKYTFDLGGLEKCLADGAKVLMMCSPNNPTGRVWTREELTAVSELIIKYDAFVVIDEIHRDIIWSPNKHVFMAELPGMKDRVASVFSTSKTFNMGGFHIGSAEIPNKDVREAVVKQLYSFGFSCGRPPLTCIAAQTAAYEKGEEWYREMMAYVDNNINLVIDYLKDTPIKAQRPEGSFLIWADISELNLNNETFDEICKNKWKAFFDPGHYYLTADYKNYVGPEQHFRINTATQRSRIEAVMERIRASFK
ncbi:MAG: aminotransferase class I/II-fold pyridoxal phosphate-dependent enzyme [Clostridia bacterium]|nr:aminotransferase class I/II-fold pyridoxal phosphate-dependent enzyme [Clostridia bacterium]